MKRSLLSLSFMLLLVLVFSTGTLAISLEYLTELNPALTHYNLDDHFAPNMGMHFIAPGPHMTVVLADNDTVVAVELVVPEEHGWLPWFDQPEGEPSELPIGMAYTQHIYLADRATIIPGQSPMIFANYPAEQFNLSQLHRSNPTLDMYIYLTDYIPGRGSLFGPEGPGLGILIDENETILGFELVFPAEAGWFAWFDQPEGQPQPHPELGEIYSQSILLATAE